MKMNLKFRLFFLLATNFILSPVAAQTQTIMARVVDAKTSEPVPYATIQFASNKGIIANDEGLFSFSLDDLSSTQDSVYISCMGYEKAALSIDSPLDSIISLTPKPIELNAVYLFDNELEVEDIIEKVRENLDQNYNREPVRQRLFLRQSNLNNVNKLDIEFKKSSIVELNEKFIDSVVSILPRKAAYYTESLCDYYKMPEESRLQIVKAAELYDKNNLGSTEELGERLETIFKENVKSNSYLKIKSGWFGQKVQVDSILAASEEEDAESAEKPKNEGFHSGKKYELGELYEQLFFREDSKLNFIDKYKRYEFVLKGYTAIDDQGVYVVQFAPKGSQDFQGTLFINIEDFAIMRLEYQNVNSLRRFKLLGLYYEEVLLKGTTIYGKTENGKYDLKFMDKVFGRKMGINRPLSVIEKNKYVKGRRKQNELALELDILNSNTEKVELVVFESDNISYGEIKNTEENKNIEATYLSQYDPHFWEGYDIMEPNQAIKAFSAAAR